MPYCLPAESASPRNHRRTRSVPITFTTDKNPTVFQPLQNIPKRRHTVSVNSNPIPIPTPRRAVFSLRHDDDETSTSTDDDEEEEEDEEDEMQQQQQQRQPLSIQIGNPQPVSLPPKDSSIPFPTLESAASSPSPTTSLLPRVSSNPIILPNGKPLKPSLKSSSSPNLPDAIPPLHIRSQSAPSTPATHFPKNVHFKDEEDGVLETVRVFNKSGKPASINSGSAAEETETETEIEPTPSSVPIAFEGFPFPASTPSTTLIQAPPPLSSPIPAPNPTGYANVFLETVTVPKSRPPVLRGSILVRNVTFAKSVAVRFTFDEWQTTSEVSGSYVTSLPTLPPELTPSSATQKLEHSRNASVGWEWASTASQAPAWDRFSFSIKLEDVERKLLHSTLFIAVRYQAHGLGGGEWWDNNGGDNYKLSFQQVQVPSVSDERRSSSSAFNSSAMFSTISHSPSFPPSNRAIDRKTNFPFPARPATPVRAHSNPSIPTYTTLGTIGKSKSRLSLSNYVAPSSFPDDDEEDVQKSSSSKVAAASPDLGADMTLSPTTIIGGMPATAPTVELSWPYSSPPINPTATTMTSANEIGSPQSQRSSLSSMTYLPTPVDSPSISPSSSSTQFTVPAPSSTNDTYTEFVKKWCFHQSPPPTTPTVPSAVPRVNGHSAPTATATANPWLENYGRPSFGPAPILAGFERA